MGKAENKRKLGGKRKSEAQTALTKLAAFHNNGVMAAYSNL